MGKIQRALLLFSFFIFTVFSFSSTAFSRGRENCTDTFLSKVGLSDVQETDPVLFRDILENEMHLGDFAPFMPIVSEYLSIPTSLQGFLIRIRNGTLARHPAVEKFLCKALDENLFQNSHST